ncbi:hypothetical protein MVEN_01134800 [Mycena venus]|uniref:Uncharacterized protein n=1 Tax=Mycena venus TaxID=2733690 RepID=A0A8H6Y9R0_9AGAR|nr:hypothetical protein MVEN_01134800 [Mycena venus]
MQCLVAGADVPTANVLALVYPPHDPAARDTNYLVYNMLHLDFVETLEATNLVYRYTLHLDSLVNDFLGRVVNDMAASSAAFIFPHARRASTAASAAISTVQLLGLRDRGRIYRDVGVRLQILPHDLDMTIHDLVLDPAHFSGRSCFRDGTFIIRLAVMGDTLTGIRAADRRRHGCIGAHIYSLFPRDSNTMGKDDESTSGGSSADEGEVRQLPLPVRAAVRPNPRTTRASVAAARPTAEASTSTAPAPPRAPLRDITVAPRSRTRSLSPAPVYSLPTELWKSSYTPHPSGEFNATRFTIDVCRAAVRSSGSVPPLQMRAVDVNGLVDLLCAALDEAGSRFGGRGDYTEILAPEHMFAL